MKTMLAIWRKEFNSFFSSPAAWLFLGSFLIINLFIFFWGEAFFARNIADVEPLFQWMPILLIFLVAALTMRSWAEEYSAGTLETLLTSPVHPLQLIGGKFFASLTLVCLALLLTLPLPITVSFIGPLDWGPVVGGYIASIFLASAYIAIGLYMSSRTDNPIVALILTVTVAGIFYLLGSSMLTSLFGQTASHFLSLIGSGSRFDSITRGVLDFRDLYYYLSIVGIFLSLNLLSLEHVRWAHNQPQPQHRRWGWLSVLMIANFLLANVWLSQIGWLRLDLTQGHIYSLSATTRQYLKQLKEPLLIRGYFSSRTHPLLEPLVPQLEDLLKEYQVAGGKKVTVQFINPHTDQSIEEAAEKYGIHPVPFRVASRYESSVVNSYFNLVIAYGDQYQTLSYQDLIDVKDRGNGKLDVVLKNPEYVITRAIRKVTRAYRSGGDIFANLQQPVTFHGYISAANRLPHSLVVLRQNLQIVLSQLKHTAGNRLKIEFADPDANGGKLARHLQHDYGYTPQVASLFDPRPFWFYMVLQTHGQTVQVPLPANLTKVALKKSITSAIQRMTPGYMKTVAIVMPTASASPYMAASVAKQYTDLRKALAENVRLQNTSLKTGRVPADTDLLLLLAPDKFNNKQLFAVDQFLMQGGSVVIASSPFEINLTGGSLSAQSHHSGLEKWLKFQGITMADSMVLDPQDASLPIPVRRQLGPITVREIKMMPYPHFPDIRGSGLSQTNPITSSLEQLTLNWASPIQLDMAKNSKRTLDKLLYSSVQSWTSSSLNVVPDYRQYPNSGFPSSGKQGRQLLAVALKGRFESYFKNKKSPLLSTDKALKTLKGPLGKDQDKNGQTKTTAAKKQAVVTGIIDHSSDSAHLVLVSSNSFASDMVTSLATEGQGRLYTRQLEFIQNAIDWSLDNQGLMRIRSRAQFARILQPMTHHDQLFWEYLNYILALVGLGLIWIWRYRVKARRLADNEQLLAEV